MPYGSERIRLTCFAEALHLGGVPENNMTIEEQVNLVATYKRMPKLKLVGQALENWLLAEHLNDALRRIIEEEESQSIRSFGLGDIAREALADTEYNSAELKRKRRV